jgi:hypothetical protein
MTFEKTIKDGVLHVEGKKVKKVFTAGTWIWYVTKIITKKKVPFIYEAYVHGFCDEFGSTYVSELESVNAVELPIDKIPLEA